MKTKKNPLLITAAVCLILLATLNLSYTFARTVGLIQVMPSNMKYMQAMRGDNLPQFSGDEGQMPDLPENRQGRNNPPEGMNPGNLPEGFDSQNLRGGNATGRGLSANTTFLGGLVYGWLGVGLYGLSLILAVVSGNGMIKAKKWAVILGIILVIILAGLNVTNLFNLINWLRFAVSLAVVLLSIGVLVLLILPGARKDYIKKQDIFDEEDYALYYGDEEDENPDADEAQEADSTL